MLSSRIQLLLDAGKFLWRPSAVRSTQSRILGPARGCGPSLPDHFGSNVDRFGNLSVQLKHTSRFRQATRLVQDSNPGNNLPGAYLMDITRQTHVRKIFFRRNFSHIENRSWDFVQPGVQNYGKNT